jgi:hypothetical protein
MTTEERLREAIKVGEVVKVVYNGGTQPGVLREIAPVSIRNGKVLSRIAIMRAR